MKKKSKYTHVPEYQCVRNVHFVGSWAFFRVNEIQCKITSCSEIQNTHIICMVAVLSFFRLCLIGDKHCIGVLTVRKGRPSVSLIHAY